MKQSALLLANEHFQTVYAKSTHGLVRGPSRWPIAGVVDASCAGCDAGELLDGTRRNIPIFPSVADALSACDPPPTHCVVGVATVGGVLPESLRQSLEDAARAGMTLVNGLHHLLSEEEPEIARLVAENGGEIVDIRKPPKAKNLHFWSGKILELDVPRVAVLGTDCALGKRTTTGFLRQSLEAAGYRAEMVFTGQTGWLQGYRHGFIFDSCPNDFVCGELEHAILTCAADTQPDVILLEGQSSLRNPSGPCGAEFLLSGAASGVVLQHAPGRPCYEGLEDEGCRIHSLESEIELMALYGVPVWAVGIHTEGLDEQTAEEHRARYEDKLGIPVVLPIRDGVDRIAAALVEHLNLQPTAGR